MDGGGYNGWNGAYALLTSTSMSLNSSGRLPTKLLTSSGTLTSIFTGNTLTPSPASCLISSAICFKASILRAVRMSLRFLGDVRANSIAVLLPMPEEAPVITIVLPSRRLAIAAVAMVLRAWKKDIGGTERLGLWGWRRRLRVVWAVRS